MKKTNSLKYKEKLNFICINLESAIIDLSTFEKTLTPLLDRIDKLETRLKLLRNSEILEKK